MNQNIPKEARLAARVILIDEQDRILFCRGEEPLTGAHFWVMPGGGLDTGETFEEAACREIYEETGLSVTIGPCVWYRRHRHLWNGQNADQYERFYVARVPSGSVIAGRNQDSYVKAYRWWTVEELAGSDEDFAPRRVAELMPPILAGKMTAEPTDCGV